MPETATPPPPKEFLQRIESLRGLAALSVAFHHSFLFFQMQSLAETVNRGIVQVIFYGHGAVLCFFVLSGFVLGQSLRRLNPSSMSAFAMFYSRRFFRIIPAFAASLIFCGTLLFLLSGWKATNPAATVYYFHMYDFTPSLAIFISNLFFNEATLNNVTWSLFPELVGSLILPLLYIGSKWVPVRVLLLFGLLALQYFTQSAKSEFTASLQYMWMFYAGYLITDLPKGFVLYLKDNAKVTRVLLALSALVCLATPHFGHHPIPYVTAIVFVVAVIYYLPQERFFALLDNRLIAFYGRISYSFYLLHFPVVYCAASLALNFLKPESAASWAFLISCILALVSIGIATPLALLSYHYIEQPFIKLGKYLHPSLRADDELKLTR